jgi:hypothetical protein
VIQPSFEIRDLGDELIHSFEDRSSSVGFASDGEIVSPVLLPAGTEHRIGKKAENRLVGGGLPDVDHGWVIRPESRLPAGG